MPVLNRHLRRLFLALCLSLCAATPLYAQDIYIKPNTSTTNGPTVDYGTKPRAAPTAPAAPVTEPAAPVAEEPPPVTAQPQPAPAPAPVPDTTPAASASNELYTTENYGQNVTVYKVAEDPPPPKGTGSNGIHINFEPSLIGADDKQTVMSHLGLSDSEVQSNCFFRYNVLLSYGNNDGNLLSGGNATSFDYRFDGPLKELQAYPSIACRKLRAPVDGMIVEQGGYYVNSLSPVTCGADNTTGNPGGTLNIRYLGDGKAQCRYQ